MKKLFAIMAAALLFALLLPLAARAQTSDGVFVIPNYLTNGLQVAANTLTTLGTATNNVTLWQNAGLAVQTRWNVGGTDTTSGSGMWISFSVDGTNYGTPIIVAGVNTSKTVTQCQTNWSAAQLSGFTSMSIQLTNASASYVMTNSGVLVSKWLPSRRW